MKVKLILGYLGTKFYGWQLQADEKNLSTVQGELEKAIEIFFQSERKKRGLSSYVGRVTVIGSGRTDRGVHARKQVASFAWDEALTFDRQRLLAALNGILPAEISIVDAEFVSDSFDARRTLHTKRYNYRIHLGVWKAEYRGGMHWGLEERNLDIAQMIEGAKLFVGRHDFANFRAADCSSQSTIRLITVSELVRVADDELVYVIEGYGFLKQMVRLIVRGLVEVGLGKIPVEKLRQMLSTKNLRPNFHPAPPQGLCMEEVWYEAADGFERVATATNSVSINQ